MGIQSEVFLLYRFTGQGECRHDLLVRVGRPGSPNWDEGAMDAADGFAYSAAQHLRTWWERWVLRIRCPGAHTFALQAQTDLSIGDDLDRLGFRKLEVWVASPRDQLPWIVLASAMTEAEFWAEQEDDDGFDSWVGPPVEPLTVDFVTDRDGQGELRGPARIV